MPEQKNEIKSKTPLKERPRYFAGRYLLEGDFELQHDYLNDRLRYHRCSLHVSGIVEGLEVSSVQSEKAIKVSPGSAIDPDGNLIVLHDEIQLELEMDGRGVIAICYQETADAGDQQETQFTRWQDSPILIYHESNFRAMEARSSTQRFFIREGDKYVAKNSHSGREEELLRLAVKLNELIVGDEVLVAQKGEGTIRDYNYQAQAEQQ
jgi:hypothetical protein